MFTVSLTFFHHHFAPKIFVSHPAQTLHFHSVYKFCSCTLLFQVFASHITTCLHSSLIITKLSLLILYMLFTSPKPLISSITFILSVQKLEKEEELTCSMNKQFGSSSPWRVKCCLSQNKTMPIPQNQGVKLTETLSDVYRRVNICLWPLP